MESSSSPGIDADLDLLCEVAGEAGRIAMRYFKGTKSNEVWTKSGDSPVSEADFAVDNFLRDALLKARPDYGWLSEETEDDLDRLNCKRLFVVDPIDGTRGFLAGRREWCVSIAIVEDKRPVAGVLECPAMERRISAAKAKGARLNDQWLPVLNTETIRTVTSSRKLNGIMEEKYSGRLDIHPFIPSLAYRIAMVATGEIDAAIARPGAHDWDLAGAEVILNEVGGIMTNLGGEEWRYNQPNSRSGSLLASGKDAHQSLTELAKSGGFLH